jgi:hypothetical protein
VQVIQKGLSSYVLKQHFCYKSQTMKSIKALSVIFTILLLAQSGYSQNCTLTCPDNLVVSATAGQEGAVVNYPAMASPSGCGALTYTPASGSFMRLGSHSVIITTTSGQKCSFTVTVTDNEPPVVSPITLSRNVLWPVSDKMKKVGVYYTVSDNGEAVKTTVTVTSNAPTGEAPDFEVIDKEEIRLKASRLPDGSPRIYTITVTAVDDAGNKTTRTTTIAVSKTMIATAN